MSFSVAFSQALEIAGYVNAKSQDEHFDYLAIQKKFPKCSTFRFPALKKISATLKKTGILTSKTGVNGGLRLAKAPKEITIYDILVAIEGTTPLFKLPSAVDKTAFVNQGKVENWLENSSKVLNQAETAMLKTLKQTTLADLDKG